MKIFEVATKGFPGIEEVSNFFRCPVSVGNEIISFENTLALAMLDANSSDLHMRIVEGDPEEICFKDNFLYIGAGLDPQVREVMPNTPQALRLALYNREHMNLRADIDLYALDEFIGKGSRLENVWSGFSQYAHLDFSGFAQNLFSSGDASSIQAFMNAQTDSDRVDLDVLVRFLINSYYLPTLSNLITTDETSNVKRLILLNIVAINTILPFALIEEQVYPVNVDMGNMVRFMSDAEARCGLELGVIGRISRVYPRIANSLFDYLKRFARDGYNVESYADIIHDLSTVYTNAMRL